VIVKLNREEIVQACVEWAAHHHGLALTGQEKILTVTKNDPNRVAEAKDLAIEFPEAKGHGHGPYREPGNQG
jgi:hypothetical protein